MMGDMQSLKELNALVERLTSALPNLGLDDDQQEEYGTMLLWLQNQVETGEPAEWIVDECMKYFNVVGGTQIPLRIAS